MANELRLFEVLNKCAVIPINGIFFSIDQNANPSTLFGGTWTSLGVVISLGNNNDIYAWKRTA